MTQFPYQRRAREVRDAQVAVHEAARAAKKYPNKDDTGKLLWKNAAARFHQLIRGAYPQAFLSAVQSLRRGETCDLNPILEFLEADPIFFGSGYMKEEALRLLPRANWSDETRDRLTEILLKAVRENGRREFRRYRLLGRHLDSDHLRSALQQLATDPDAAVRRRAEWTESSLGKRDSFAQSSSSS